MSIFLSSGTTDATVPLSATRRNIAALKLKVQKKWYPWNHNDQVSYCNQLNKSFHTVIHDSLKLGSLVTQLAGWIEVYEGLTFVAVMGAGHEVPMYLPSQAHALFKSFLSDAPMPKAPPPKTLRNSG